MYTVFTIIDRASCGRVVWSTMNRASAMLLRRNIMLTSMRIRVPLLLLVSFLFLISCSSEGGEILSKDVLFTLDYGKMEDQIDLYKEPGVPFTQKTRIYMRDGIFYVSNGNSNKVMEFTSYGDILSLYYNEQQNPETFMLRRENEEGENANRKAYTHPFREVGEVVVNSRKEILVEDKVGERQAEFDQEIGAMLNRVVLRFDKEGNFLDYLGQEGIGGTPFPFIHNIRVTDNDEIVVVSRSVHHWLLYWFSPGGALLYKLKLSVDNLPIPEGRSFVPSLSEVTVDRNEPLVYLKIEYYGNGQPASKEENRGDSLRGNIHFKRSYIWFFNVKKERYVGKVEVPVKKIKKKTSDFEEAKEIHRIYDYIGVSERNTFFLLTPQADNTFELLLLRRDGSVVSKRYVKLVEKKIHYRDMYVTSSGVLVALLAKDEKVEIAWWRSDRLMEGENENS